ncbi:putative RNA methyltransferase At5g10620 isoform X2 [Primulina tabacum]|uniref:putative RNA methyltransferase At5g10620 isoform X2 n=1 Tax=Primulina tabacum TaxID=48773 RepID=UPI003F592352
MKVDIFPSFRKHHGFRIPRNSCLWYGIIPLRHQQNPLFLPSRFFSFFEFILIFHILKHLIQNPCQVFFLSGKQCKYAGQTVRALPIRILTVGKKRSPGVQLIVDEYIEKLKIYCSVQDIRLKSNPKNANLSSSRQLPPNKCENSLVMHFTTIRDVMAQIEHEDISVMSLVKSNEWVVMLDEHGADVGSEQMASLIGDAGNTGASSIVFCIGGPYGHGRQLKERADVSIKLSSLVLNHEVALVVLIEQLYRAWTILKGQKYHH